MLEPGQRLGLPSFHARFAQGDFQQLLNALLRPCAACLKLLNTLLMALRSLFQIIKQLAKGLAKAEG